LGVGSAVDRTLRVSTVALSCIGRASIARRGIRARVGALDLELVKVVDEDAAAAECDETEAQQRRSAVRQADKGTHCAIR
jgi:hypothetical protein